MREAARSVTMGSTAVRGGAVAVRRTREGDHVADPGQIRTEAGVARAQRSQQVPDWLVNLAALGWRVLAIAGVVIVGWFVIAAMWTTAASILVGVIVSAVFAPLGLRLRAGGRSADSAALIVWAVVLASVA